MCARLSGLVVLVYARHLLIASNRHTAPRDFRCMAGIGEFRQSMWHIAFSAASRKSKPRAWLAAGEIFPEIGEKTTYSKMSTDKTSSVAAAVLQPLEGVATPVPSMN